MQTQETSWELQAWQSALEKAILSVLVKTISRVKNNNHVLHHDILMISLLKKNIIFLFWLPQVLVEACGILVEVYGAWAQYLQHVGLVPRHVESYSLIRVWTCIPVLEGKFFTTGPPGKNPAPFHC